MGRVGRLSDERKLAPYQPPFVACLPFYPGRYDIAWKYVQYGRIWEHLRSELEVEQRFETLDMKLALVQDNLKYFLELLQARKSDSLEWTIILLIGVEICLSLYELGARGS